MNIKEVKAGIIYYVVGTRNESMGPLIHPNDTKGTISLPTGVGYFSGDSFTYNPWNAVYYDTKEEAEGGIVLAVCKFPEQIGQLTVMPFRSNVTTLRGPDRKLLRGENEEGLQGR